MSERRSSAGAGREIHYEVLEEGRTCEVCQNRRLHGEEMHVLPDRSMTIWVCVDCEKQLMRGVDDDVKGG